MAETHSEFLQQLEAESRKKQQAFMENIATRLKRSRITAKPVHPFRGAPDFWRDFNWTKEEKIARFTSNFKSVGGYVERFTSLEEAKQYIVNKAQEMKAEYIIRQNQVELNELDFEAAMTEVKISVWNSHQDESWKARAAEADFGIVVADYAAAYTGSITVLSSRDKGRSVSLLPTVLMAIIPVERIKTRLGEILVQFDEVGGEQLPAGIHFISGPSRSADIENDLTIGVHGPGIVHALIVG